MKTKYALLSAVLTIAVTLPMVGQDTRNDPARAAKQQSDISGTLGTPTVDATVEGLHMKVWLMTQEQHKAMMKGTVAPVMIQGEKQGDMGRMTMQGMRSPGTEIRNDMKLMKHGGTSMIDTGIATGKEMTGTIQGSRGNNRVMPDSMTAGTHHIRVDATDAASGKDIANASAKVLFVSPSAKNGSVDLTPMMNHLGGALTLNEKGEYRFTVSVTAGAVSRTTQFLYAVK